MPRGARWRRGAALRGMQRRPSPLAAAPAAAAAALTLVQLVGCAADAAPGNSTGGVASSATFLATAAIGALGALALVLAAVVTTAAISHRARQRLKRGSGGSGTGSAGSSGASHGVATGSFGVAREALPLGWANALMRSAWPAYIEAKMASVASRSAQRALDELVSEQPRASAVEGVYLESLTWGTRPPSMGHAAVEWDERGALSGGSVRFEFDACFHAPDFCAQVAVRVLLLGGTTARVRLSELEIEGRVVVQFRLGPNAPGVEGIDVSFVRRPTVKFEVSALGLGLPLTALPGVKAWFADAATSLVERFAVEPAREYVDIAGRFAASRAREICPSGDSCVLSLHLVSARCGREAEHQDAVPDTHMTVEVELVKRTVAPQSTTEGDQAGAGLGEVLWAAESRSVPWGAHAQQSASERVDIGQWFYVPLPAKYVHAGKVASWGAGVNGDTSTPTTATQELDVRVSMRAVHTLSGDSYELAAAHLQLGPLTAQGGKPVWLPLASEGGGAAVRLGASLSGLSDEPPSELLTPAKARDALRSPVRFLSNGRKGGPSATRAQRRARHGGGGRGDVRAETVTFPSLDAALDDYDQAVRRTEDAEAARAAAEARAHSLAERLEASRQRCAELATACALLPEGGSGSEGGGLGSTHVTPVHTALAASLSAHEADRTPFTNGTSGHARERLGGRYTPALFGSVGGTMKNFDSHEDFESEVKSLDAKLFSNLRSAIAEEEDDVQSSVDHSLASASVAGKPRPAPEPAPTGGVRTPSLRTPQGTGSNAGGSGLDSGREPASQLDGSVADEISIENNSDTFDSADELGGRMLSGGGGEEDARTYSPGGDVLNTRLLSVVRTQRESISAALERADSAERAAKERLATLQDMLLRMAVCGAWFSAFDEEGKPRLLYVWVDLPSRAVHWAPPRDTAQAVVRPKRKAPARSLMGFAAKLANPTMMEDVSKVRVPLKKCGQIHVEHLGEISKGASCFPSDRKAGLTRQLAAAATGGSQHAINAREASSFSLLICEDLSNPEADLSDGSMRSGDASNEPLSDVKSDGGSRFVRRGVVRKHCPGLHLGLPPGGNGLSRDHWVLAFEHALTTLRGVDSRPVLVAEERQRTGTSRTNTILSDTFAQVYSLAATAAGAAVAEQAASPARA